MFSNTKELILLISICGQYKKDYPESFAIFMDKLIESYLHYFFSFDGKEQKFYKNGSEKSLTYGNASNLREAFGQLYEVPLDECDENIYFYLAL